VARDAAGGVGGVKTGVREVLTCSDLLRRIEAGLEGALHLLLLLFDGFCIHPTQKKSAWTSRAVGPTAQLVAIDCDFTTVCARQVSGVQPAH